MDHFVTKMCEKGSKTFFPKKDLVPFGVLKQDNCAHFEAIWTQLKPHECTKLYTCGAPTTMLWSHLEMATGV